MTVFARILLVATSLAPMLLVAGCAWLQTNCLLGAVSIGVALLLTATCLLLLGTLRRRGEHEALMVTKVDRADKDVLAFLFTYVLPLLTPATSAVAATQKLGGVLPLVVFVLLMAAVLFQAQLHSVNPVIGLFGYHFFDVEATGHATILVLTRRGTLKANGEMKAIRLSEYLWLEAPS